MGVFSLKPARPEEPGELICDLDALISKPAYVKFGGRTHKLKPVSTAIFFQVTNALNQLSNLPKRDSVSPEQFRAAYTELFKSVCDTIGDKEVEQMTLAQANSLLVTITQYITGAPAKDATPEEVQKKKT